MIARISDLGSDILERLEKSHYSRRIRSHFDAYKTAYDFCSFFLLKNERGDDDGIISLFNSSLTVSPFDKSEFSDNEIGELAMFIEMTKPVTVELDFKYSKALFDKIKNDYNKFDRTEFEFVCKNHIPNLDIDETPKLERVFDILKTSFPIIKASYPMWLTDTSHRVRRGLSQCFILDGCSSATIQYIVDGIAFVGHVATIPPQRGKRHARQLLYWLGERLNDDGLTVRLNARSYNVSYYTEIGFKPVGSDIVLERKDIDG